MSIERADRQIIVECDSCPEQFKGEIDEEFRDVMASAKREGWHVAKVANEWLHGCPRCGRPS